MALSPMMQQYTEIKQAHEDCLLMYRLGDFYELFFDDALTASRELELTLTGRNCGLEERAPMCGVPFHSAEGYIARLVEKGHKVAICEQVEDPAAAKGIVRREVVRVVTPGTVDPTESSKENIYIASVFRTAESTALAYADITTGEFCATEFKQASEEVLLGALSRLDPKELLVCRGADSAFAGRLSDQQITAYLSAIDETYYRENACADLLKTHFSMTSLVPLGLEGRKEVILAAGSLLLYLTDTQKQAPAQIKSFRMVESGNGMNLDRATIRNMELIETLHDKQIKGSLLGVLDRTKTAMGARLLRHFLKEPLKDATTINRRLDAVEALSEDLLRKNSITAALRRIYDFERLTARVAGMRANGKDLIALKTTLAALPELKAQLRELPSELLTEIAADIDDFAPLHALIEDAMTEEPPFTLTEGGLIRPGYSQELDELKASIKDAKAWIAGLEGNEKERTGIKTLKVGYNKVFGYYLDVSKSYLSLVPEDYIRKQTLVNNERYITPELKEKESLVLSAEAKINALEYELFKSVRTAIEPYISDLQRASSAVALLDVLVSFADLARSAGYVKPTVDDSTCLEIKEGRHPVVEQMVGEGFFIANDTRMDTDARSMLIITGPNMSGKSTYMRQTAVIVLMAQMGSFVPCKSARIGVVDRVFTRIGAADNLAHGQSTFYVEMSELANILRNATTRSLIILDEIGRGTSTFDGLSIAWATIEYLCRREKTIRTMFATHYHELTALEQDYDAAHNLSVAVSEEGRNVVFLHRIIEGPASKSYGIHVAKIAGVPQAVRRSAEQKLRELEAQSAMVQGGSAQLSFFTEPLPAAESEHEDVLEEIRTLDLNGLTPIAALMKLKELQDALNE